MQKHTALISIIGFFGLLAGAHAQMPPPAATTAFDGTYRVVSSTRVNQMYTSYNGQTAQCPDRKPSPLHVARGRAHYTSATKNRISGTVGAQGELAMQSAMIGGSRPFRIEATGMIDANGTAQVHQKSASCNYDYVWSRSQ